MIPWQGLMWNFNKVLIGLALLMLTACAPKLEQTTLIEPEDSQQLHVRMQIIATSKAGKKTKFDAVWERSLDENGQTQDVVNILSPLGGIHGQLIRRVKKSILKWGGKTYEADDANRFTHELLGYTLPLEALGYWMKGRPSPLGAGKTVLAEGGLNYALIEQYSWKVAYLDYDDNNRPKIIELHSDVGKAKVKIKKWLKF